MLFNPAQFINMLGGMQSFNQKLNQFQQNFNQQYGQGADPSQMGQQLLNSGKMSQEQFEQFRQIANMVTGKNY